MNKNKNNFIRKKKLIVGKWDDIKQLNNIIQNYCLKKRNKINILNGVIKQNK